MSQGYHTMLKDIAATGGKGISKGDGVLSYRTAALFVDVAKAAPDASGDGKLLSGTAVKVIDVKGDWAQVKLDGWQQEGAERVIYALKGQRILSAALGPDLMEKVQRQPSAEDPETGLVWSQASLDAWVAKDALVKDEKALWAYGAEMYGSSCGSCHNLPQTDHMLANQVTGTLNAMKRFISLDDEEYRFVQKYMQLNAQDTGGKHHE